MAKKKELIETFFGEATISEVELGEGQGKTVKIEGIGQRADTRNANGRVYRRFILERELKKFLTKIESNTSLGEVDHPSDGRSTISNTGILWESAELDKQGIVRLSGKVLETAKGKDLRAIALGGGRIGISSRGHGTTRPENFNGEQADMVNEDYNLVTFDAVSGPSTPDAYVTGVTLEHEEEDVMELNLEQLEKEHPELYAKLKAKIEETLRSEFEQMLQAKLDERAEEIEAVIQQEYEEQIEPLLTEAAARGGLVGEAAIATILDVLAEAGYLGGGEESEEGEEEGVGFDPQAQERIDQLEGLVAQMQERLEETHKGTDELTEHVVSAELNKYIDECLKNDPYAKQIRPALERCSTVDEINETLAAEKERVREIVKKANSKAPAGIGQQLEEGARDGDGLTETQRMQQRLAGIMG